MNDLATVQLADVVDGVNARADLGDLETLTASIKEGGVLVPLTLRTVGPKRKPKLEIVCGHRRAAAAREAGLTEVPAFVRAMTDEEARTIAAVDNLLREDLGPMEEAEAYRQLRDDVGLNPKDIAARTGLPVARVGQVLLLLDLPANLRDQVEPDFPLSGLKWVLKVPEKATTGREDVFRDVARGTEGKSAYYRCATILDPEGAVQLEAKPSCLDCPKQRRHQEIGRASCRERV